MKYNQSEQFTKLKIKKLDFQQRKVPGNAIYSNSCRIKRIGLHLPIPIDFEPNGIPFRFKTIRKMANTI